MIVNDVLISNDYDLLIANGDFVIGESTPQHQQLLLLAGKGDYKLTPLIGVDVFNHLHDHSPTLARDARIEFIKDGMQVQSIKNDNGKIIVDAKY
jgi:hypothetical protein